MKVIYRTNDFATIFFAGKEKRCRIKVNDSGVDYVNASGFQGRRKVEFYADGEIVEMMLDYKFEDELVDKTEVPEVADYETVMSREKAEEKSKGRADFKTLTFKDVIDTGREKAVAFEIERFNESVADEDAVRLKAVEDEIAEFDAQIVALQKRREEKSRERDRILNDIAHWAYGKVNELRFEGEIELVSPSGGITTKLTNRNCDELYFDGYAGGYFKIGKYTRALASYETVEEFKAAVYALATAIAKGDKKFVFPNKKAAFPADK